MIGKITIAMYLCVNSYYTSDFELKLLENVLDSNRGQNDQNNQATAAALRA